MGIVIRNPKTGKFERVIENGANGHAEAPQNKIEYNTNGANGHAGNPSIENNSEMETTPEAVIENPDPKTDTPEPDPAPPTPPHSNPNPGNDELPRMKKQEQQNNLLDRELGQNTNKDLKHLGALAEDMRRDNEDLADDEDDDNEDEDNEDGEGSDNDNDIESDASTGGDTKLQKRKAKLTATIKVNTGALALNKICCALTGDWSSGKYKLTEDERKMIIAPMRELELIKLKEKRGKSNPGTELLICCIVVALPILIMAFVDMRKKYLAKQKEKKEALEAEENKRIQALVNEAKVKQNLKDGKTDDIKEVQTKENKKEAVKKKGGRHAKTCPAHSDKSAKCNCK